ncbi:LCP family protein [Conexibacter sp. CPCC 206217]|uniref:LCP family protein n=1 Tax=Conexibacter sp. CPCC 206217 TaxID=3064574 RepID=UPI00271A046B|nr:LCP family protein [Conexibacter sp. CPCC 206217]MDO8211204.1 LCP family protein [Conexibacter sp. CPCC 206217]
MIVIVLTAAATATAGLLNVQKFVDDLKAGGTIRDAEDVITRADAGDPQTLLLIGSDHRYGAGRDDSRSDTMMLMRIDPDAAATTVLSIPRDLKVTYTDRGGRVHGPAKINETYTIGGEALTASVISGLLGIRINHIANVNFTGFREVIDQIGCVYVDVDRRYYHVNTPGTEQWAEINLMPGYQLMCGQRALDYVRFRHFDSDFVRGARQQDFLRQVRSQYDAAEFIQNPHEITRVIGRRMQTDADLHSVDALLKLAQLVAFSASKPIQQIAMRPYDEVGSDGAQYVVATDDELRRVRRAFLHPDPAPAAPRRAAAARRGGARGRGRGRRRRAGAPAVPAGPTPESLGLVDMTQTGKEYALQLGPMRFPVYYPRYLPNPTGYMTPNAGAEGGYPLKYRTKAQDGRMKQAYRFVVDVGRSNRAGNYMGVQGMTWTDPPILTRPSADHRTINGKKLDLYYDGKQLRLVAWRQPRAVYWISNTLEKQLSNDQMLAIAGSLTRLGRG